MRTRALVLVLLLSAACGKKTGTEDAAPVRETAAGVDMIDYDPPKGTYACRAPARWKGDEDARYDDDVTFIGPLTGPQPVSVSISISRYPNSSDQYADAEEYAKSWELVDGKPTRYTQKEISGRSIIFFSREYPYKKPRSRKMEYMIRKDVALIPVKGGFFEIAHSAPSASCERTLPVFKAVVRSFQPKS